MVIEEDELMTTAQVAKYLGVTQASISKWCSAGDFPHAYRKNPRTRSEFRIPKRDVEAFIERRRKQYGYYYVPVPGKSNVDLTTWFGLVADEFWQAHQAGTWLE